MSISANRIRLALELTRANFPEEQMDAFTSATPRAPHGRLWDFELGLFDFGELDALVGLLSITVEVKAVTANGVIDAGSAALMSRTVAAGTFNAALTAEQWASDSGNPSYHAKVSFSDVETAALDMGSAVDNVKMFGFAITALTAAGRITIGGGLLAVMQDGGTGAGAGSAPVAAYTFSDQEILAMLAAKLNAGENDAAVSFTLRDEGGSGWGLRFSVVLEGGLPVLRQSIVPP